MQVQSPDDQSVYKKNISSAVAICIILFIAVIVGGYFLYQTSIMTDTTTSVLEDSVKVAENKKTNENISVDTKTEKKETVSDTNIANPVFPPLTDDERSVLNPPQGDASEQAKVAHFSMVEKIAVESGELKIGSACSVSPVVLKTQMGKELIFRNYDSVPHTIAMPSEGLSFPIPANGSVKVPATFGKETRTYGYICDQSGLAGIILAL